MHYPLSTRKVSKCKIPAWDFCFFADLTKTEDAFRGLQPQSKVMLFSLLRRAANTDEYKNRYSSFRWRVGEENEWGGEVFIKCWSFLFKWSLTTWLANTCCLVFTVCSQTSWNKYLFFSMLLLWQLEFSYPKFRLKQTTQIVHDAVHEEFGWRLAVVLKKKRHRAYHFGHKHVRTGLCCQKFLISLQLLSQ